MYRRTPILYRILDSFFRHQRLFWLAVLIVSSLTMGALYARSKTFHASAMTQVQTDNVATNLGGGENYNWSTPSQFNVDRFMELVKQDQPGGFLDTALQNAHLTTPISVNPQADDPRYGLLEKNLSASPESTNQFSINLTWDNPDECAAIVDALQKQYIEEKGLDKASQSVATVNFLNGQIAKVEQRLHRAEKALTDFKQSNNGQLSDAESNYGSQLASLKADLDQKQITAGESGKRRAVFEQELASMKPMSVLEQSTADQSPLEREVADLLARRDGELAAGKTPQHPDVVALDDRITALQQRQRADARAPENQHNTLTKTQDNPQYTALKEQIAEATIAQESEEQEIQNTRQQIAKYQALVAKIPEAQRQLTDKTRDYSDATELFQNLQQQRDKVKIQADMDRLTASSSLEPIGVTFATPTTGRTKLIAMLFGSLLLGCLVGLVLIVLSEWSDHSLRHEADAERLLGVPVLAALPEAAELRLAPARHALSGGGSRALPGPVAEG